MQTQAAMIMEAGLQGKICSNYFLMLHLFKLCLLREGCFRGSFTWPDHIHLATYAVTPDSRPALPLPRLQATGAVGVKGLGQGTSVVVMKGKF